MTLKSSLMSLYCLYKLTPSKLPHLGLIRATKHRKKTLGLICFQWIIFPPSFTNLLASLAIFQHTVFVLDGGHRWKAEFVFVSLCTIRAPSFNMWQKLKNVLVQKRLELLYSACIKSTCQACAALFLPGIILPPKNEMPVCVPLSE